ncbi:MAG TPA: hypothetical protein VHH34_06620 [Pseudonocardiaceae bacterium]|nr:hypothetical protein [Pseudonocardiaceae bacterium]
MPDPDHPSAPADDLFGVSSDPAATGPIRRIVEEVPPPRQAPAKPSPPRRWTGRGAKVAACAVLVLVLAAIWAWSEPEVIAGRPSPDASPGPTVPGAPGSPATAVRATPAGDLAERASRTDTDCAAHSYGQVQKFLTDHPCRSVRRALYTGTEAGEPVVVAVSTVEMASESDAAALQKLADVSGTGNVSDLLREGVTFDGAPSRLRDASYASQLRGPVLVIVEAATVSGAARPLDALAEAALALGG